MGTLAKFERANSSSFTWIEEHRFRPGILLAFLGNAIVEIDAKQPENLKILAGKPDVANYSNGAGSEKGIRFNNPWDLVQLRNGSWVISDSGNNCLRKFNYSSDPFVASTVHAWTKNCDPSNFASQLGDMITTSNIYRPRGLTHSPDEEAIYVSYEKPYSLAIVYIGSNRIALIHSNSHWNLLRIVPLTGEFIFSTQSPYVLLSYRDHELGTVIGSDWQFPKSKNSSTFSITGVASLEPHLLVVTLTNDNALLVIDRRTKVASQICSGTRGDLDSGFLDCQLNAPSYVTRINDTLYIGERGRTGARIRTIQIRVNPPGNSATVTCLLLPHYYLIQLHNS